MLFKNLLLILAMTLVSLAGLASENEKFVSLKDLELYSQHPIAKVLALQLESFARNAIPELNTQTLISIRPQQELEAGRKIKFVMFFLQNKKSERGTSLLVKISADLSADKDKVINPSIDKTSKLSQTKFTVQVSLIELKAKVYDAVSDSTFIYPTFSSDRSWKFYSKPLRFSHHTF